MGFTEEDKQRVQKKWEAYQLALTEFRRSDVSDPSAIMMLEDIEQAKDALWLEVAEITKEANPSLMEDVKRGSYKHNVNYLVRNFEVVA